MLKNIRQILEGLPNTPNFKLRDDIKKYITDEYDACMSKFILENDSGKEYIENITPVNICLELASAYSKLEDEPGKTDAVEEAAEKWCILLGIDYKNIGSIFKDVELKNNVFYLLRNDDDLVSSLKEIYWFSGNNEDASKNVKLICDIYREYGKQNRENLI